jgi:hypothetical protein
MGGGDKKRMNHDTTTRVPVTGSTKQLQNSITTVKYFYT